MIHVDMTMILCGYDNDSHKIGLENPNIGTTLIGIAKSFWTFAEDFAKVESNYLHVPILNNKLFEYGNRGGLIFDNNFFAHWADTHCNPTYLGKTDRTFFFIKILILSVI